MCKIGKRVYLGARVTTAIEKWFNRIYLPIFEEPREEARTRDRTILQDAHGAMSPWGQSRRMRPACFSSECPLLAGSDS